MLDVGQRARVKVEATWDWWKKSSRLYIRNQFLTPRPRPLRPLRPTQTTQTHTDRPTSRPPGSAQSRAGSHLCFLSQMKLMSFSRRVRAGGVSFWWCST
eukprot:3937305-Rhodomonas_salina.4